VRRFTCQVCGAAIAFAAAQCDTCGSLLGYDVGSASIAVVTSDDGVVFTRRGDPSPWWRCLNFAWGCNWMLAADTGNVWCESCRLTRGRPDESSLDAVLTWSRAEAAKRRLVANLHALGLPVADPALDGSVVFDLVHLPESRGVTGHRPGVVTLDLREVDDGYREATRIAFGEADRTVLGHLRHEIGHHYFGLLVERAGALDDCRALFGDERADYADALQRHYSGEGGAGAVPDSHISDYATAHPGEDWAETFGHYLALRDGLETAHAFGLADAASGTLAPTGEQSDGWAFPSVVQCWRDLTSATNELALGLGHIAPYPYRISPQVEEKLAFVHRCVCRWTTR